MSAATPTTAATWSARIRRVLPTGWFAEEGRTPVLDALLAAFGLVHAQTSVWVAYARLQTRLATATDDFLDGIAADFTGIAISRETGETDTAFRARIQAAVLRPRDTRAALALALTNLTGHAPAIFEPADASDTGGYGVGAALAYGVSGGYGSRSLPYQAFVTVYRPSPALGPVVGGGRGLRRARRRLRRRCRGVRTQRRDRRRRGRRDLRLHRERQACRNGDLDAADQRPAHAFGRRDPR